MKTPRTFRDTLRARPAIALYAFIAGVVVAGGLAFGSIPAANGVITGCYNKKTGALRVIDISKAKCHAGTETQLKWNQKGAPPGKSGLTCSDEQRIKAAAPAFVLSAACVPATTTPPETTTPTTGPSGSTTTSAENTTSTQVEGTTVLITTTSAPTTTAPTTTATTPTTTVMPTTTDTIAPF